VHVESCVGFDYSFDSLHSPDENQDELNGAIRTILKVAAPRAIFTAIQIFLPIFRRIVSIPVLFFERQVNMNRVTLQPTRRSRVLDRSLKTVQHIGSELIQNKKNEILAECDADGSRAVEKQNVRGHDLLSLLIKSNIASDMPESMRMSDSEILSRERLLFGHPCSVLSQDTVHSRDTCILDCRA
jgi:hypothetical protein